MHRDWIPTPTRSPRPLPLAGVPGWALFLGVALAYAGLARYVIVLNDPVNLGAGFWPAAGLTVAVLLSLPTRRWGWVAAAVVVAETGVDLLHGYPLVPVLWWAAANAVEPIVGAALVRRAGNHDGRLAPVRHLLVFVVGAGLVGPLVGGTIGSIGTVQLGMSWWQVWPKFVVGDALGVLTVAPALLTLRHRDLPLRPLAERLGFTLAGVATLLVVFHGWSGTWDVTLPYLVMPLVIWAGMRFGVAGAAGTILLVTQVANAVTAFGSGPFASVEAIDGHAITLLQVFLGIVAGTGLLLAALATELSSRAEVEQLLADQAHRDHLTGLPNRRAMRVELERALAGLGRGDGPLAVCFCDLDRFKLVNDGFGHEWGDALLVEVANRLRSVVRPGDLVARFGGDEFVVLCRDLTNPREAASVARRLLAVLGEPMVLAGRSLVVSGSIGIAVAEDADVSAEDLLRDADTAMYTAKERGKNRFEVFDTRLRRQVFDRLRIEDDLRAALQRDEFELAYQPILSASGGHVIGAEALLRWHHPERGPVAPGAFLEIAEETGLIVPIGDWVLATALDDAASWPQSMVLSVNLSPRQLQQGVQEDLPGTVARICAVAGMDPARLWFEVVETAIHDVDATLQVLHELHDLGVRIALDDFGTGYASLGRLRELPFDVCKIDRSFVAGLQGGDGTADRVVRAVTDLAHAYGMTVVAEGVESREQHAHVLAAGCDLVQGFGLHAPMSAESLSRLLRLQAAHGSPPVLAR